MKALVTGATGFVGPRLLRLLDKPVVVSRNPDRARQSIGHLAGRLVRWDPLEGPPPPEAFEGIDVVYHLAGESVAGARWTAAQKARIRDSRVVGTRHLVQGIAQAAVKPATLVSASAVGYYGSRGDEELTESAPPADDFLARVCVEWEREALAAADLGVRVVTPRTGALRPRFAAISVSTCCNCEFESFWTISCASCVKTPSSAWSSRATPTRTTKF